MKELKELLKKKAMKGEKMSPMHSSAMANVIKELEEMADSGKAKGLSKVTVASDSKEGLETGLEMAKDKVSDMEDEFDDKEGNDDVAEAIEEVESEDSADYDEMDLDEEADDAKMSERDKYDEDSYDEMDEESPEEDYDSMSEEELEKKIAELEAMKSKLKKY